MKIRKPVQINNKADEVDKKILAVFRDANASPDWMYLVEKGLERSVGSTYTSVHLFRLDHLGLMSHRSDPRNREKPWRNPSSAAEEGRKIMGRVLPKSLYIQCMDFCIPRLERGADRLSDSEWSGIMEQLGGPVAEDLLTRAFHLANGEKAGIPIKWKDEWKIFYTSKISSAIFSWNENLIDHTKNHCKNLKRIEVVHVKEFDAGLVLKCPPTVITLDFDGELMNRGNLSSFSDLQGGRESNWLCHSDKLLRSLFISNVKIPDYALTPSIPALCELHLGNIPARSQDLAQIIRKCGNLRVLKHYQLVSALYELHSEAWRRKEKLPVYKLKNLDADFSHVVRCRMSPEWVLAPDAFHLAVKLCPQAKSIRVRFDCGTPNDVLTPLIGLESIRELSAVCVSSGERSLMDFSDVAPVLDKHGPESLTYLELKVIEEVEVHVIIEKCRKLDTLILSGCGYVTPSTCASYGCRSYGAGSLRKLRLLFYADGDDFSWDHGVPTCFWRATLFPSGMNQIVHLQGIFLEYPRISRALTSAIFMPERRRLPFPNLVAFCLCRYEEIGIDEVASVCGLSKKSRDSAICPSLRYIRLSQCDKFDEKAGKTLKKWATQEFGLRHLQIHVDGT